LRYNIKRKERKDIRRGRKRIFFAVFAHSSASSLRFLDQKLNLFSDETPMMRCLTTNQMKIIRNMRVPSGRGADKRVDE